MNSTLQQYAPTMAELSVYHALVNLLVAAGGSVQAAELEKLLSHADGWPLAVLPKDQALPYIDTKVVSMSGVTFDQQLKDLRLDYISPGVSGLRWQGLSGRRALYVLPPVKGFLGTVIDGARRGFVPAGFDECVAYARHFPNRWLKKPTVFAGAANAAGEYPVLGNYNRESGSEVPALFTMDARAIDRLPEVDFVFTDEHQVSE